MSIVTPGYSTIEIANQAALFSFNNKISSNQINIEDVGNSIPGSVMVQDMDSLTNVYMNNNGCEILKHSKEELNYLGPEYYKIFFPAEEISMIMVEIKKFLQLNDPTRIYSFFQRVRPDSNSDYKWYLSNVRLLKPTAPGESVKLINIALAVDNISYAAKKINSICEQTSYVEKNYFKYLQLTKREKEIIYLIASGYNSRYISDSLFISLHTVNNHRKNIISKLHVKGLVELMKFAVAFSII